MNNMKSKITQVDIGIAQESMIGTILVIIYISDLQLLLKNYPVTIQVDDTNFLIKGNNINEIDDIVELCSEKINE